MLVAGGLLGPALSLAIAQQTNITSSPPTQVNSGQTPSAAPSLSLTLAACLDLAVQHQPRVAAQRASLAAAVDGKRALDQLHVPPLFSPDLPVRRRQAALGVTAAAAGVDEAERESVYAVTRAYFTVIYAREQERLARSVVDRLSVIEKTARDQVNAGAANVTTSDVQRTTVYLRLAGTRQIQASKGVDRALASLKEAIGLDPCVSLDVPVGQLIEPVVHLDRDEAVAAALSRRGELVQASVMADATCLEAAAQDSVSFRKRLNTFAAGSDIHSRPVPQGVRNSEYRPGGVPPEMPTLLAGARPERVRHACDLNVRAVDVVAITRNLLTLEAEDAFLRWQEAALSVAQTREAADTGDQLANELTKQFTARLRTRVEDVVNARVLASQARSQYNEFLYREIIALADLERITAGGFSARLAETADPAAQPTASTK
jgi:outer membrane protein TolC